jgi:hypothetical protein
MDQNAWGERVRSVLCLALFWRTLVDRNASLRHRRGRVDRWLWWGRLGPLGYSPTLYDGLRKGCWVQLLRRRGKCGLQGISRVCARAFVCVRACVRACV